jgi:hypothetical protein
MPKGWVSTAVSKPAVIAAACAAVGAGGPWAGAMVMAPSWTVKAAHPPATSSSQPGTQVTMSVSTPSSITPSVVSVPSSVPSASKAGTSSSMSHHPITARCGRMRMKPPGSRSEAASSASTGTTQVVPSSSAGR